MGIKYGVIKRFKPNINGSLKTLIFKTVLNMEVETLLNVCKV